MRAGRGIRTAAVLMAGLVGAAVIAPGMAFAADTDPAPPTVAVMCASDEIQEADGSCEKATTETTSPATTAPSTDTSTEPPTTTTDPVPSTSGGAGSGSGATGSGTTPSGSAVPSSDSTSTAPTSTAADTAGTPAAEEAAPALAPEPADTVGSVSDAASTLAGTAVPGGTIGDVLKNLPTGNLTGLGTIPALPASGTFDDARDACLYLASKVNAPAGQEGALGEQFAGFCGGLPSTSTASITDLITALTNLLKKLQATPAPPQSTSTTVIHTWWGDLPASFRDLDCAQLTYDEAQAVLAADRDDPNHLDRDHDGIACERNYRDYHEACDDYDGYPVGAVATGDSAPLVAPGVGAALAGLALAAVAGAAPGRPEGDQDGEDTDDPAADDADLLIAGER